MAIAGSLDSQKPSACCRDEKKVFEDCQAILAIAIVIIITLGEARWISPIAMGGGVIGLASTSFVLGCICIYREDEKKSDFATKIERISFIFSLVFMIVLSSFVVSGHAKPLLLGAIAMGFDISTQIVRIISRRSCGSEEEKYSCFQPRPNLA